jgi:hypothetical protein
MTPWWFFSSLLENKYEQAGELVLRHEFLAKRHAASSSTLDVPGY